MPQIINGTVCYTLEESEENVQKFIEESAEDLYNKLIMKKNSVL